MSRLHEPISPVPVSAQTPANGGSAYVGPILYSTNMRLHIEFWVEEHSEITDNRRWRYHHWYDVGSGENVFVDRRDVPRVCCRPKPHHLFSWCSAECASTSTRYSQTSHKLQAQQWRHERWTAQFMLDALHVVSKEMVADTMLLENVGDILCVGDEGPTLLAKFSIFRGWTIISVEAVRYAEQKHIIGYSLGLLYYGLQLAVERSNSTRINKLVKLSATD